MLKSMLRFNPDGVFSIDPASVIAPPPAKPYDVMPQLAGLLQLILEKRVRYTKDGYFIIEKPIERFPADLAGVHSVKTILAEGVEMAKGIAGHSSVYSAETGECLSRLCNR